MAEDKRKCATRIQAGVLKAMLADVIGAVESRNTIPILANVLIEVGVGTITLTSTNLDVLVARNGATADRDGAASADWLAGIKPFATTVEAKPLAAILAVVDKEAMVTLQQDDARLIISAGRAKFKLATLSHKEFPQLIAGDLAHSFDIGAAALADAFAAVEYAISTEETRYYLNGVLVHVAQEEGEPQWLVLATTDGHRLARLRSVPPEGAAALPQAIWPRGTVHLLDKLLRAAARGDAASSSEAVGGAPANVLVEISDSGMMLRFTMDAADGGEITLTSKAIDGTFPDYTRVIPHDPPLSVLIDRATLAQAVKRVGVLAQASSRAVKAEIEADKLTLVVTNIDVGEAREEVPCSFVGEPIVLGLNGAFWLEALGALACEQISMAFHDAGSPVLLRAVGDGVDPARHVQVLMPMRV